MELTTQIISGIAVLFSIVVATILIKNFMTIPRESREDPGIPNREIESFLEIDMDTLVNESNTQQTNVQELKKKLNQFKNRNRFYNL